MFISSILQDMGHSTDVLVGYIYIYIGYISWDVKL